MARKSQGTVSLNTKLSAVNIMTVPISGDGTTFAAGAPITLDYATGKAGAPSLDNSPKVATPDVVFINWFSSTRSDVSFVQRDAFDDTAPEIHVDGGGLACIVGNGVDVGLPASLWTGGVLPTVGEAVYVSDGNKALWAGESPVAGDTYYGMVYRIYNGRAYFLFDSMPRVLS